MKKLTLILSFFIFTFLFNNCTNQKDEALDAKNRLIEKIIEAGRTNQKNGKIVISSNTGYCKEIDCMEYFKGYENEVVLYDHEFIFMRGLRLDIKIINIDKDNKEAIIETGKLPNKGQKTNWTSVKINI